MGRRPSSATSNQDPVTQFLRSLPHTGVQGFEGLVAAVLEAATGQRFRIAGSGFQAGMDMASEAGYARGNRIKAETKNYFASRLNLRELTAEITQATRTSDLDLWVLASTCPMDARHAEELMAEALGFGIECLFLDRPANGLARLDVLMAAHCEAVEQFAAAHHPAFDLGRMRLALDGLRSSSGFENARLQLASKLSGTLLGYDDARKRASAYLRRMLGDAGNARAAFNQQLGINDPGAHKVERVSTLAALDQWWRGRGIGGGHAVLLGELGMGKSWSAFDWASRRLDDDTHPIYVPLVAAASMLGDGDTLATLLPRVLANSLGFDEKVWALRLTRWLSDPLGELPLIAVIVDGLNEKPSVGWPSFFRTLHDESWRGKVVVLSTDRPGHWMPECSSLRSEGFTEIAVKRYGDAELAQALGQRGLTIDDIPEGPLQDLVRTPLYCGLLCAHLNEMMETGDPTVERLLYLDMRQKRSSKAGYPLTEDDFNDIVKAAASRYRKAPDRLDRNEVRRLSPIIGHRDDIYQELVTGGLLVRDTRPGTASFRIERTRLVYGLGMLLAEEMLEAIDGGENDPSALRERIASWLEPHPGMDLKVDALGSALFHAYLDEAYPELARRELLAAWLGVRNQSAPSQAAFTEYVLRRPEDFIALADRLWLHRTGQNGAGQEFLARAFLKHRDHERVRPALVAAVRRWMGMLSPLGHPLLRHGDVATERMRAGIEGRVGHPLSVGPLDILGERLTVVDDDGLLGLRRFGLLIISAGDRAPFAGAFTTWAIASAIEGGPMEGQVADWAARLADDADELEDALLQDAARLLAQGPIGVTGAHILLRLLGNKAARDLADGYPEPESEGLAERRKHHEADPCRSFFAWSPEERRICMERGETRLETILQRTASEIFDPTFVLPPIVLERATKALDDIDRSQIQSRFHVTSETSLFETLVPVLATRGPEALLDFVLAVVRTLPKRDAEGCRQLALWLRQIGPLLGSDEVDAVKRTLAALRSDISGWRELCEAWQDHPGQLAEAFLTLGLLPALTPDERWDEVRGRPELAIDLDDLSHWFEPVSHSRLEAGLHDLQADSTSRTALARIIWMLPSAGGAECITPPARARLQALSASPHWVIRALVARFACLAADATVGRAVVDLGNSYSDGSPSMEMEWGAKAVLLFSEHLAFEQAASRLHPATAGRLLSVRGSRPQEADIYGQAIDDGVRRIANAPEPPSGPPPAVRIPDAAEAIGNEIPKHSHEPSDGVTLVSADATWLSGGSHRATGAGRPTRSRRLLDAAKSNVEAKPENHSSNEHADALQTAWATTAFNWYGRSFDKTALGLAAENCPRRLRYWGESALRNGNEGRVARFRLGSFLVALCEGAFEHDPSFGLDLWRALRSDRSGPARDDLDDLPFRAGNSPECDVARNEYLGDCIDDEALSQLAVTTQAHGGGAWLKARIGILVSEKLLHFRALGLTLASFADLDAAEFEGFVEKAGVEKTWVGDLVPHYRITHQRNIWAKHWHRRFLVEVSADRWWPALEAFFGSVDARYAVWCHELTGEEVSKRESKMAHLGANRTRLKKAVDKSKQRKKTYLGVKVEQGEVAPFLS